MGSAQQLIKSEPLSTKVKASNYLIIGKVGNHYLVNNFGANIEKILAYDANSLQLKTEEILFTSKSQNDKQLNAFAIFEDSLFIFYSQFKDDQHIIEVNKKSEKLKGNHKYIDELALDKKLFEQVTITTSTQQNKYLLQRHYLKDKEEVLSFTVLNNNLKEEATVNELAYPPNTIFHSSLLGNNGVAFIIFKSNNPLGKKGNEFNGFVIYQFSNGQKTTHYFHVPNFKLQQNFFAINAKTNELSGVAYATKPNKSEPALLVSFTKLNKDTLTPFLTELEPIYKNKKKISLRSHEIREIIFRQDNGLVVVSESKKVETAVKNQFANDNFNNALGIQQIVYGNIFLASLNVKGAISWHHFIPKNQVLNSKGSNYGSFGFTNNGNQLNFIYNESTNSNASFMQYTLNAFSKSKRKLLFSINDEDVFPVMQNAKQITSNTILFNSLRNDEYRLCKLYLEN